MATAYVIWDRAAKDLVGGGKPLIFDQSADATAQATFLARSRSAVGDEHRKPATQFDVLTVTV